MKYFEQERTMKLIGYFRVSTKRQGESGLGLEAQKTAVEAYAKATGATIAATFTEIESGKLADRPELAKAIAQARRGKSRLCIAKLDRLARNVAFVSALMDSGVDFVACDNPHANRLTLHILSAVAEDEARRISERTRAALTAAKARGTLLGSARPDHWKGREHQRLAGLARGRKRAAVVNRARAAAAVADLVPEIQQRREKGESYDKIAAALNDAGQLTPRGCRWTSMGVKRVADRMS
jgi:DNA invertase Pin-like site-specific DNA recombinase